MARFGLPALRSATGLARSSFRDEPARALFAGVAAHAMLSLDRPLSASFGLVLATYAHAVGWPMVRGGTAAVGDALVAELRALGGEIVTDHRVASVDELPPARATLLDVTPRQALAIGGRSASGSVSGACRAVPLRLRRLQDRLGARRPDPLAADGVPPSGTVHLGGTLDEIATSKADVAAGDTPIGRLCCSSSTTPCDPSRAPDGASDIAWAYCHVPGRLAVDMTERIEAQVERFAPGFRDRILARHTMRRLPWRRHDANYIGGDINGGIEDIRQLLFRPWPSLDPYRLGDSGLYLCSSSTPPGGGVHGMCGMLAARSALRHELR